MFRLAVAVAAISVVAGCGGDADRQMSACGDVWVEGADVAAIIDEPCDVDGEPTYYQSYASLECDSGESVRFNNFGHWRSDVMTLHTDWNSAGDYSLDDVENACSA